MTRGDRPACQCARLTAALVAALVAAAVATTGPAIHGQQPATPQVVVTDYDMRKAAAPSPLTPAEALRAAMRALPRPARATGDDDPRALD